MDHEFFMKKALGLAKKGQGYTSPNPMVGAVIVKDGEVKGKGYHQFIGQAHAEVNAIRNASQQLQSPHLTGAVIYSNFEPCPMCLAAIYWADIRALYFSKGRSEAEKIGFMDKHLYHEFAMEEDKREIRTSQLVLPEMESLIGEWMGLEGKNLY